MVLCCICFFPEATPPETQEVDCVFKTNLGASREGGCQAERLVRQEKIIGRDYGGFALVSLETILLDFRGTSLSFSLLSWKGKAKSTLSCNCLVFRLLMGPQLN